MLTGHGREESAGNRIPDDRAAAGRSGREERQHVCSLIELTHFDPSFTHCQS